MEVERRAECSIYLGRCRAAAWPQPSPSATPRCSEGSYAAEAGGRFCHARCRVRVGTLSATAMSLQLRKYSPIPVVT